MGDLPNLQQELRRQKNAHLRAGVTKALRDGPELRRAAAAGGLFAIVRRRRTWRSRDLLLQPRGRDKTLHHRRRSRRYRHDLQLQNHPPPLLFFFFLLLPDAPSGGVQFSERSDAGAGEPCGFRLDAREFNCENVAGESDGEPEGGDFSVQYRRRIQPWNWNWNWN